MMSTFGGDIWQTLRVGNFRDTWHGWRFVQVGLFSFEFGLLSFAHLSLSL